jgi:hypothetical protein
MFARILLACTALTFGLDNLQTAAEPKAEQKMGRIEGRILEFPTVNNLTPVRVRSIDMYVADSGQRFATAESGEDGRFVFENVPAGRVQLNPQFDVGAERKNATLPKALRLPAIVRDGETLQLALFGKGRPVVGKLVLPPSVKPESVRVRLEVPSPPRRVIPGVEHSPDWDVHTLLTASPLESKLDAEGRFRIEGIREGNYRLGAYIVDGSERLAFSGTAKPGFPHVEHGSLTIPFMKDGGSDESFNLGSLLFDLAP